MVSVQLAHYMACLLPRHSKRAVLTALDSITILTRISCCGAPYAVADLFFRCSWRKFEEKYRLKVSLQAMQLLHCIKAVSQAPVRFCSQLAGPFFTSLNDMFRYSMQSVHVPREVVWLNGAPGAGKGANTQHILKTRGLDHSICLSTLLVSILCLLSMVLLKSFTRTSVKMTRP